MIIRGITVSRLQSLLQTMDPDARIVFLDAESGLSTKVESGGLISSSDGTVYIALSNAFDLGEKFESTGFLAIN